MQLSKRAADKVGSANPFFRQKVVKRRANTLMNVITLSEMLVNPKAIATFALLGLLLAVLSKVESVSHRPLPSLRNNPSEWYTPDFYPNGSYVELPMGTLRYWLFGNPEGKRVVLIHGISTGSAMYDKLARHLVKKKERSKDTCRHCSLVYLTPS